MEQKTGSVPDIATHWCHSCAKWCPLSSGLACAASEVSPYTSALLTQKQQGVVGGEHQIYQCLYAESKCSCGKATDSPEIPLLQEGERSPCFPPNIPINSSQTGHKFLAVLNEVRKLFCFP